MSIRPVFRIATAGLDERDVRLIEIVFRHSQYNRYDFQMLPRPDPRQTDILIVNPATPSGLDALSALRTVSREIPALCALPRGTQTAARHAITIERLTLQLLPTLNRVVELEGLEARLQPGSGHGAAADGCGDEPADGPAERAAKSWPNPGSTSGPASASASASTPTSSAISSSNSFSSSHSTRSPSATPASAKAPAGSRRGPGAADPDAAGAETADPGAFPGLSAGLAGAEADVTGIPTVATRIALPLDPDGGDSDDPGRGATVDVFADLDLDALFAANQFDEGPAVTADEALLRDPLALVHGVDVRRRRAAKAGSAAASADPASVGRPSVGMTVAEVAALADSAGIAGAIGPGPGTAVATVPTLTTIPTPATARTATDAGGPATFVADVVPGRDLPAPRPAGPVPVEVIIPADRMLDAALVDMLPSARGSAAAAASATALAWLDTPPAPAPAGRPGQAPSSVAPSPRTASVDGQAAPRRGNHAYPLQLLVADPSLAAQQQIVRALQTDGIGIQCVAGASAALLHAAERQFDLIITEYSLADVGGFHLIRALRQRPGYRSTPVLLLRSRTGLLDLARARLLGDVLLLTKPLTRAELQAVVADALRRSLVLDDLETLYDDGAAGP